MRFLSGLKGRELCLPSPLIYLCVYTQTHTQNNNKIDTHVYNPTKEHFETKDVINWTFGLKFYVV